MDSNSYRDLTKGSASVVVTVIDDGIQSIHPDLDGLGLGYDPYFGAYPDNAWAPYGNDSHGTHVAGIIAATQNSTGMAGVAPNILLTSVRIFRADLPAPTSYIGDGINFAWASLHADVISNSWGGGNPSNYITNAIQNAVTAGRNGKGTVVVFSAGNTSARNFGIIGDVHYPANLSTTIAVGAINRYGYLTNYTPEGPELDLVAPSGHYAGWCNGDVVSLDLLGYAGRCDDGPGGDIDYTSTFSGTSAAAPQVSAAAALLLSREPGLTVGQVKQRLFEAADYYGPAHQYGNGKLNAYYTLVGPPTLGVTIEGPNPVKPTDYCTWFSGVTGGTGPYSYSWYKDGAPVGGNNHYVYLYTGSSNFLLRLVVTEPSSGKSGEATISVTLSSYAQWCDE